MNLKPPPGARVGALLAALMLCACATPTPPAGMALAAPAQWHAVLPHGGGLPGLRDWWQRLNDPLLVQLIDAAQASSPTLAAARSRIEQARASQVAAGAALGPRLDAQASAQRGNTQVPGTVASSAQLGLQTAWEIDLFGGNRLAADAAQARLDGAQAGWHEARVSVAAETANQYTTLRSCERQLVVALADAASRAETARLAELSARAGFTAPAGAALARASAAEGSARATQQRAQCATVLKALVALTAIPEPEIKAKLAVARTDTAPATMFLIATLPASVLAQRPDVFQAERDVAAASAEVGSARAQQMPRLSLSGSIAVGRARAGGVGSEAKTWAIGPLALSLPLFDGGRLAANTDAASARYTEAVALYQARVRQAVREVEEALVNLDASAARSDDAQVATEGYRASLAATDARYKAGLASLVELEDARRTALAAQTALIELQRERVAAWIALYRAAGGGWERPPASTAASATSAPQP